MVIDVVVGGPKCLLRLCILLGSEALQVFDGDETVKPCWDWRRMERGLGLVLGANPVVGLEDVVGAWSRASLRPLGDDGGVVRLQDDEGGVRLLDVGGATDKSGIRLQNLGRRTDGSGATVGLL